MRSRLKGEKIWSRFSRGMPDPLSATLMVHSSAVAFADTTIRPGRLSMNFTAFESRL